MLLTSRGVIESTCFVTPTSEHMEKVTSRVDVEIVIVMVLREGRLTR